MGIARAFEGRRRPNRGSGRRRAGGRCVLFVVPLVVGAVLALAPSAFAGTTVVNVPAAGQGSPPSWTFWTSSGVTLAAGEQAVVSATSGAWGICQPFTYGCPLTSLNGANGMGTGTWTSAYGSFVPGSLVGSLDGTHWFEVGAGPTTVTGPGTLLLAMWDVPTDYAGYSNNDGSMDVQIATVDTTPPALSLPSDITAEATGPDGAAVTYAASATDNVDGAVTPDCSPASGSTFALGTTTVDCTATDAAGNQASGSFSVTVQDTTPPAVTASLVRVGHGGDDESTQFFRVVFSASDAVGVASLTADLNGVTVHDGQLVLLQVERHGPGFVLRWPILHVRAASFTLTATASDAAGNSATATATPTFVTHGRDEGGTGWKGGRDR